jgi:hypothetical protein
MEKSIILATRMTIQSLAWWYPGQSSEVTEEQQANLGLCRFPLQPKRDHSSRPASATGCAGLRYMGACIFDVPNKQGRPSSEGCAEQQALHLVPLPRRL